MKIAISGPMGSGKTTIANMIKNSYKEYNDPTGINDYSINIGYDF